MPLTGYTAASNDHILIGTGVLYADFPSTTPAVIGASVGDLSADLNPSMRMIRPAGVREPIVGMHEAPIYAPTISGQILVMSADVLNKLILPGSTSATGGTGEGTVITPKAAGSMLAAADFITDLRWVIDKAKSSATEYLELHFPRALCSRARIVGRDEGYPILEVEFQAVKADAATPLFNLKPARTALPTT